MVLDILWAHAAQHRTTVQLLYRKLFGIMHFMVSFSFVKGKRFFVLLNMLPWRFTLCMCICCMYTYHAGRKKKTFIWIGKIPRTRKWVVAGVLWAHLSKSFALLVDANVAHNVLSHMAWMNLICIEVLKIYKFLFCGLLCLLRVWV